MPTPGEKFRALLATGRVANLPTVCSNVLAAFWLSSTISPDFQPGHAGHELHIPLLLSFAVFACMIYLGGCLLGDVLDAGFDRQHRPGRPIPQGILQAKPLLIAVFGLFTLATTGLVSAHYLLSSTPRLDVTVLGCLLVALVITYALYHKRNKAAALVLMASCRLMLVTVAMAAGWSSLLAETGYLANALMLLPFSVGAYTLLLSWVASSESSPGAFQSRHILASLLLAVPLASLVLHLVLASPEQAPLRLLQQPLYLGCLALLYLWLVFALRALKSSKPAFVSRALAGFCLLDACFLAPVAAGPAGICLLLFVLALVLQRIAPAT